MLPPHRLSTPLFSALLGLRPHRRYVRPDLIRPLPRELSLKTTGPSLTRYAALSDSAKDQPEYIQSPADLPEPVVAQSVLLAHRLDRNGPHLLVKLFARHRLPHGDHSSTGHWPSGFDPLPYLTIRNSPHDRADDKHFTEELQRPRGLALVHATKCLATELEPSQADWR